MIPLPFPMALHLLRATAATALILLITVLPFLPGSYDPLAATLSGLARAFGFVALLLVPVGIIWTVVSLRRPAASRDHAFARAALIVWTLVSGLLSMAAVAASGWLLALAGLALSAYVVVRLTRRIGRFKEGPPLSPALPALYLVAVPLAVVLLQQPLVRRGVQFSRDRAISHAAPMIAAIEGYRAERNSYPVSLLSVHRDYPSGVVGIDRFHYEPHGEAYNLVFENPAVAIGTQEFVVYNPRDEQVATSHLMDILEYTPEHLQRTRGYYAAHSTPHAHWKYFWFD